MGQGQATVSFSAWKQATKDSLFTRYNMLYSNYPRDMSSMICMYCNNGCRPEDFWVLLFHFPPSRWRPQSPWRGLREGSLVSSVRFLINIAPFSSYWRVLEFHSSPSLLDCVSKCYFSS